MEPTADLSSIQSHATDTGAASGSTRISLTALALALGVLWFVLCRHLSQEWRFNEQYSYGWFVPFFAAYLFWLRWRDPPAIEIRNSKLEIRRRQGIAALVSISALLLLFPLRLFEIGNPDWRPLEWLHAAIAVFVTLALIWKIGGKSWLTHFAFPVALTFV